MQAKSAGEQAVAKGYMRSIAFRNATHGNQTGNTLGPGFKILSGVAYNGGVAGGAGGRMVAHDFFLRHREQSEGIVHP